MRKRVLRKAGAALLALTMTVGMMTGLPIGRVETRAENTLPDATRYATAAELMENYDLVVPQTGGDDTKPVQSVYFGQDGNGNAQVWKIAGEDSGVTGKNIVLFAASPLSTSQVFSTSTTEKTYVNGTEAQTVYANHYGASDLRKALLTLSKKDAYFNGDEQNLMNQTTIYTKDTRNNSTYSTKDVLYAAYGDYDDQYITVGTNSSSGLNDGIRIDIDNWGTGNFFWLRSPYYYNPRFALGAFPGDGVLDCHVDITRAVVPAFNLNLSSVIFASAASAASSSTVSSGVLTEDADKVFTIRYDAGKNASESAVISPDGTSITISGITKDASASGMYLVVQTKAGTYAKAVGSDTPTLSPGSLNDALGSFDNAKVWLESTTERITTAKEATKLTFAAPTASVAPDTYTKNQTVTLSSVTSGVKIYYTLDGTTDPTSETGTEYTAPIEITGRDGESVTTTIKAIAVLDTYSTSVVVFTYTINLPQKYAVNVQVEDDTYGTATASNATAVEGDIVTLTATTKTGYAFKKWTGLDDVQTYKDGTTAADRIVKFEMPAKDVTATATFEEVATYQLTVNHGTINGTTGEKRFEEGEKPTIKAIVPEEKIFDKWEIESGDVKVASASNAMTTATIGKEDSVITALFKDIKDVITRVVDLIIKKKPAKTTYKMTEEFNPAGLVVQARGVASPSNAEYTYTLSEDSDGYQLDDSEFDSTQPGEYEIHVKYDFDNGEDEEQHFNKTFTVEVLDEYPDDEETYVSDIKIKTKPVKQTYDVDEAIDLTGLVVVAKQRGVNSGAAKDDKILMANDYDVEYDFSTAGTRKVTILYYNGGKSGDKTCRASFTVKVLSSFHAGSDPGSDSDSASSGTAASTLSPWIQISTNVWQYKKNGEIYAANEWIRTEENGKEVWYHFGTDAIMQTGWMTDHMDGHRYYLNPISGRMATGWVLIDGVWYYFNETSPEESGWFFDTAKKEWVYVDKGRQPLGMWIEGAVKEK